MRKKPRPASAGRGEVHRPPHIVRRLWATVGGTHFARRLSLRAAAISRSAVARFGSLPLRRSLKTVRVEMSASRASAEALCARKAASRDVRMSFVIAPSYAIAYSSASTAECLTRQVGYATNVLRRRAIGGTVESSTGANMNAPLGSYRAMAMEPPLDPPDVEEGLLSMQPLGDAQVMVEYALGGVYGLPCVVGAWIAGEFVEEHEFSTHRVERWTAAIMAELEKDKEDAQAAAWAERQERCE